MHALLLGGTRFVGRHIAETLNSRGHLVTVFHRGTSEPQDFPDVEHLHGDRNQDLQWLIGDRRFDAVVDTSAYTPGAVDAAIATLGNSTKRYLFVSTVSVYAAPPDGRVDENSPREVLAPGASENEMVPETYGALKALCEDRVVAAFRERATIVRPGLVVGPFDPTDRFTYWPVRFAEGGDVLVPGPPERPTQFVDARDLAEFCADLLERNIGGTFNAASPPRRFTFGDVFRACGDAAANDAHTVYADDAFLLQHDVGPWMEFPLWIPGEEGAWLANAGTSRAQAAGLRTRDLSETVGDTLEWARGMKRDELKAGMKSDRERSLLAALREEKGP